MIDEALQIKYEQVFNQDEAKVLFENLSSIKWDQHVIKMYGKEIPAPRLFAWMGEVPSKGLYGKPVPITPWNESVLNIKSEIFKRTGVDYDSCNINFYRSGNDHLGWHIDPEDEGLWTFPIASVSLGASRLFQMRRYERINGEKKVGTIHAITLESGSLLVMPAGFQARWLHRLPPVPSSRNCGSRINLTFRRIKKWK